MLQFRVSAGGVNTDDGGTGRHRPEERKGREQPENQVGYVVRVWGIVARRKLLKMSKVKLSTVKRWPLYTNHIWKGTRYWTHILRSRFVSII